MTNYMTKSEAPVVILGYGVAAVNTLIGLRTAGYAGAIQVISNTQTLPYSPIMTSYYAGGIKTRKQVFPWSAEELDALNAQVFAGQTVELLDVAEHVVRTDAGEFPYSKCVIATGAHPIAYGFPKNCGYEPLQLRTLADAERLKVALDNPACERVLVSGASMVGLKILEACLKRGKSCTLAVKHPQILNGSALFEAAKHFEDGLVKNGVQLRLSQVISEVEPLEDVQSLQGRRLRVTFSNGDTDVFDQIAVAHGVCPNLEFIPQGALEIDHALVVDDFMCTSNPDVYAAGDVAQAREMISGEKRVAGIWKSAARQGAIAGRVIAAVLAGRQPDPCDAFEGSLPANTINVMDTLYIGAGVMAPEEGQRVEREELDGLLVLRIYEGERLVGFNLVSDRYDEGGRAFDLGAMLTLRIEKGARR